MGSGPQPPLADWIRPGTFLAILGAGPQQVPAYETARRLGVPTVALDMNPAAPAFGLADRSLQVSVKDAAACLRALETSGLELSGVITSGVEVAPVVSAVAERFGLTAVPPSVAWNTTHKGARSTVLDNAGVPIPKFRSIESGDLSSLPGLSGPGSPPPFPLPWVVKPTDGSGSRGVRLVREQGDLASAFAEAAAISSDGGVIVEEYLPGKEISIEGFVHEGELKITGFAERNFIQDRTVEPYFLEDGSTIPTTFPEPIVRQARQVFRQAVKALGIEAGPTKGDLTVSGETVRVLEVTSRLSPGFASRIVPLTSGVELLDAAIRWATGGPVPSTLFEPKFHKAMAHRYYRHRPGRITAVHGMDRLPRMPGVEEVLVVQPFQAGDVLPPLSYMSRLFYIITVADDPDTAVRLAEQALASVRIDVEAVE